MTGTCFIGAVQLYTANQIRFGWTWSYGWSNNASTILLSCSLYGVAVGLAVTALLTHQIMLIGSGRTAYEARRHKAGGLGSGASWEHIRSFERQTATLSATVAAAWVGRRKEAEEVKESQEGDALVK